MNRSLKSTPPRSRPIGGIRISLTSEVTMVPKAAPMITPTARSTTLPRMMNVLNSFSMAPLLPRGAMRAPAGLGARTLYNGPAGRATGLAAGDVGVRRGALGGTVHTHPDSGHPEARADPVKELLGHEPERNTEDHRVRDQVLDSHRPSSLPWG